MATLPVKLFRSDDAGAPTLNGVAGSLVNVLDGCLATGYNTLAVTSITQTGGTATLTLQAGHGFVVKQTILTAGAAEADFNGEFLVTGVSATTLTFAIAPSAPGSATGSISVKAAPAGWSKAFSGTNKAAYRGASGTGFYLRVDDGQTQWPTTPGPQAAAVTMYKTMSGIDTGTGAVPPVSVWANNRLPWHKSNGSNATAKPWVLVASAQAFYLFVWPDTANCYLHGFGDFASNLPSDANNAFLLHGNYSTSAFATASVASTYYNFMASGVFGTGNTTRQSWAGGDYSGYNAGGVCCLAGNRTFGGYGLGEAGLKFPNPLDNGFFYSPLTFVEQLNSSGDMGVRCSAMPGLYTPQHANPFPGSITTTGVVPIYTLLSGFAPNGGDFVSIPVYTGVTVGNILIDITAAWL